MLEILESISKEVCKNKGVAFYAIEQKDTHKGQIFIIYITKMGGVSVTDCKLVSKEIDRKIDTENIDSGKFFLEVSSPGLERHLKGQKQFAGAINDDIKIKFKFEEKYKNIIAKLIEVQAEFIRIKTKKEEYSIRYEDIKTARTYFDYKKEMKK